MRRLFQAFREQNNVVFYKIAEEIIAEELAANHHALANDLKKSLGRGQEAMKKTAHMSSLALLPKDRRNGESLVTLKESTVDLTKIVLGREARPKIERVIDEHHRRTLLAKYGLKPKSKLLFWGPPGCGKTYTAHYLAYELGLPIGVLRLSAVISSYLGDTASHLQRVFDMASNNPMILLLDEADAVGKNRDDRNDVGELKRVVNSLLQAMDSFESSRSLVIAASNHQYLLDSALWRRFDDVIHFPLPDKTEREQYLRILLSGVCSEKMVIQVIKNMTTFSYADIERVTVEALKTMVLQGRRCLNVKDLSEQISSFKKVSSTSRSRPASERNE